MSHHLDQDEHQTACKERNNRDCVCWLESIDGRVALLYFHVQPTCKHCWLPTAKHLKMCLRMPLLWFPFHHGKPSQSYLWKLAILLQHILDKGGASAETDPASTQPDASLPLHPSVQQSRSYASRDPLFALLNSFLLTI